MRTSRACRVIVSLLYHASVSLLHSKPLKWLLCNTTRSWRTAAVETWFSTGPKMTIGKVPNCDSTGVWDLIVTLSVSLIVIIPRKISKGFNWNFPLELPLFLLKSVMQSVILRSFAPFPSSHWYKFVTLGYNF